MGIADSAGNLSTAIGLAGNVNSLVTTGNLEFADGTNADVIKDIAALRAEINAGFRDLSEQLNDGTIDLAFNEPKTALNALLSLAKKK